MLHALKRKTVGIGAGRNEPVNAEFENIRQSLDNVSKALNAALSDVDSAEKSWNTLVSNSTHFSSGLHSLYPEEDDLREVFKRTLENLEGPLSKEMASLNDPTSKVRGIERMVRAYLTEIKTLTAEYSKVEKARKDYVMYQAKVDKLGQKEGQSDKQSRNLDKLEAAKATYHSILDGTIYRMKSTYEKAPTMFRAAYVSYWLYQSQMTALVQDHFKESFTIAKTNSDSLFSLSESAKSSGAASK